MDTIHCAETRIHLTDLDSVLHRMEKMVCGFVITTARPWKQ